MTGMNVSKDQNAALMPFVNLCEVPPQKSSCPSSPVSRWPAAAPVALSRPPESWGPLVVRLVVVAPAWPPRGRWPAQAGPHTRCRFPSQRGQVANKLVVSPSAPASEIRWWLETAIAAQVLGGTH